MIKMRLLIGWTFTLLLSFVTMETKPDISLSDVVTHVGQKFEYLIGDEQFLKEYEIYKIVERGSKKLPNWLSFDRNTSLLVGVPLEKDVGIYNIKMRACLIEKTNTDCHSKISRSFQIDVVEPLRTEAERGSHFVHVHAGNGDKLRHHGSSGIHSKTLHEPAMKGMFSSVYSSYDTGENPYFRHCDGDEIAFYASLVLHVENTLSGFELIFLINCMSKFLSKDVNAFRLSQYNVDLLSVKNKHLITAGPGNVIESLTNSIELIWHVACAKFEQISDFSKVLQHNIDTGRLTAELGHGIIAWYVFADRPLPRRMKRNAQYGRQQTATPSLTPPLPSLLSSSSVTDSVIIGSSFTPSAPSSVSSLDIMHATMLTSSFDRGIASTVSPSLSLVLPFTMTPTSSAFQSSFSEKSVSWDMSLQTMSLAGTFQISPSFTSVTIKDLPYSTFSLLVYPSSAVNKESFSSYTFTPSSIADLLDISNLVLNSSSALRDYSYTTLTTGTSFSVITESESVFISNHYVSIDSSHFNFSWSSESFSFTQLNYFSATRTLEETVSHLISSYSETLEYSSKTPLWVTLAFSTVSKLSPFDSFSATDSNSSLLSLAISQTTNFLPSSYIPSSKILSKSVLSYLSFPSVNSLSVTFAGSSETIQSSSTAKRSDVLSFQDFSDSLTVALSSRDLLDSNILYSAYLSNSFQLSDITSYILTSLLPTRSIYSVSPYLSYLSLSHYFSFRHPETSEFLSYSVEFPSSPVSILTSFESLVETSDTSSFTIFSSIALTSHPPDLIHSLLSSSLYTLIDSCIPVVGLTSVTTSDISSVSSEFSSPTVENIETLSRSGIMSHSFQTPFSSVIAFISSSDISSLYPSLSDSMNISLFLSQSGLFYHSFTYDASSTSVLLSSLFDSSVSSYAISFDSKNISSRGSLPTSVFNRILSASYNTTGGLPISLSFPVISQSFVIDSSSISNSTVSTELTKTASHSNLSKSTYLSVSQTSDVLGWFSVISSSYVTNLSRFVPLSLASTSGLSSQVSITSKEWSLTRDSLPELTSLTKSRYSSVLDTDGSKLLFTSSHFLPSSRLLTEIRPTELMLTSPVLLSLTTDHLSPLIFPKSMSSAVLSFSMAVTDSVYSTRYTVNQMSRILPSSKIYTTAIPDGSPRLLNPVNQLEVHIGKYYEYHIPYNTFNDTEDGGTRNLSLKVNLVYGKPLPKGAWLMFNETSQTLYGIPLWQDIVDDNEDRIMTVILSAKDSNGNIEKDAIQVVYNKSHFMGHSHKIHLEFDSNYKDFMHSRRNLITFGRDLAGFYGDSNLDFLTFLEVQSGSLNVVWSNSSLSGDECHRNEIQALFDKISSANGSLTEDFQELFSNSSLNIMSAKLEFVGVCLLPLTTELPSGVTRAPGSSADDKIWIEVVIPALVAILLLVIVALILLICCRHRHSRKKLSKKEKPMFLEDRRPIIFPEELEMTDPNLKPKTPLVLPSDLASDAPPPVPPHRGRNIPQHQAPASEDDVFLTDSRPPPPQFGESQVSDPPPYRLPPPYFNPHRSQR